LIRNDDEYCGPILNRQYAVDIMPGEYTFREHTTGGPPDKIFEESCFLERLRNMMVMEDEDTLWLARATPRAWLDQGQRIVVRRAPSHFGMVSHEILSDVEAGKITATVDLPSRRPPRTVRLRLRHPRAARIRAVEVNGAPWKLPPGRRSDPRTRSVCRRRPLYRRRPGLVAPMHQYRVFPWDDELPP